MARRRPRADGPALGARCWATSPSSWCSCSSVGAATTRTPGSPASSGLVAVRGRARCRRCGHRALAGVRAWSTAVAALRSRSALGSRGCASSCRSSAPCMRRVGAWLLGWRRRAVLIAPRLGTNRPPIRRWRRSDESFLRALTSGVERDEPPSLRGGRLGAPSRWANGPAVGDGTGTLPRQVARREVGGPNLEAGTQDLFTAGGRASRAWRRRCATRRARPIRTPPRRRAAPRRSTRPPPSRRCRP